MKIEKRWIFIMGATLLAGIVIGRGCAGRKALDVGPDPGGPDEVAVKFWTCSMHPEIQLPDPGPCPKCAMDLIPVMESQEDEPTGLRELKLSPTALALAEVETAPVERRFATTEIRMVGKVDFDESKLAYLTAWVPGRLDRLYVDYTGVQVNKGDHMVSIYSPDLLAAQEELIQSLETVVNLGDSDMSLIKDRAADTVVASREKLRLWGLADEQIEALEKRRTPDDHLTIYSPISGIVIHKNALEGGYVQTGTRIYTIADLSQVWVKLDAYESDLSWLHYGQEVVFETESYPGRTFRGTIAFIDPVLNDKTRTVKVRVNVDNRLGDLKPGMFVRATVRAEIAAGGRVLSSTLAGKWISPMHPEIVKDEPGACDICGMPLVSAESLGYVLGEAEEAPLVIPASAPLITGRRAIVYVKSPDRPGVFEGREIVLGQRAGDYYLVRRGLSEGEQVVTKGAFKLDAELQIHAKPSMMTPEGGGGGGGHDHGGSTPSAGEGSDEAGGMLSPLIQDQLHAVLGAAKAAEEATQGGDLEGIREAFATLSQRVDEVTAEDIGGHLALLWKEYAMFLGNDGLEGRTVDSPAEAKQVVALLLEHSASMKKRMGLSHDPGAAAKAPLDPTFLAQFGGVVAGYLDAQRALVAGEHDPAVSAAKEARKALSAVDMARVTGADHTDWMETSTSLDRALSTFIAAEDLDTSRERFSPLSDLMMAAAERFGAPDGPLYQFRCPMALGGEGAIWLQIDKETRNPYYGDRMLRCGSMINALAGTMTGEGHDHD